MANSAFEQRQTGNASEAGAGSVQQATPAEVAAKTDTGSSGAPLFVPPSLIPSGVVYDDFIAYEDIAAGDAVGVSAYDAKSTLTYDGADVSSITQSFNQTQWLAQKFNIPANGTAPWILLEKVIAQAINLYVNANTGSVANITISIRSSLSGADLLTTGAVNVTGFGTNTQRGLNINTLAPGDYFAVIREVAGGVFNVHGLHYSTTSPQPPGVTNGAYISTDSGANWTNQVGRVYVMQIYNELVSSLGHLNVFKSNASAFNERFGFVGFAQANALAGAAVKINSAPVQTLSGLTVGQKYFLQNANGLIGTSPGTKRVCVGYAVSATKLVYPHWLQNEEPIAISSGITFQMAGIHVSYGANATTLTLYKPLTPGQSNTFDRVAIASLGSIDDGFQTVPVSPGTQIAFNGNTLFYPRPYAY